MDIRSHIAVDRSHGANPVLQGGQNLHVAHGDWPMETGTRLQLPRLKSRARLLLGSQTARHRRFLSPRPRPLLRTPGPRARLATQVSREGPCSPPAAHLQPTSVSTSQADGARSWCRRCRATNLMVSAPPQAIVSAPLPILAATPTAAVSAPMSPPVPTGFPKERHVQAAHREQRDGIRRNQSVTKMITFW